MTHRLAVVIVCGFIASAAFGATVQSETLWGGASSEVTEGVAAAADGSTVLAGSTSSFSSEQNVFAVKFAADGSLVWQQTWDGPSAFFGDTASDAAAAADGSVYVSGTTLGTGGDALLLKFASDGTLLWQRTFGGSFNDYATSVAVAPDGSVYLTGLTHLSSFDAGDLFLAKFDAAGNLLWQRVYGTADDYEEGQGVAVAPDGTVSVAGVMTRAGGFFQFDALVLQVDPAGTLLWQRAYATGDITDARGGVAVGADGSVYVAAAVQSPDLDTLVLEFSSRGTLGFARRWGGRSGDAPSDIAIAADGTILLSGSTNSFGQGDDDAFLLQVSRNGKGVAADTWGAATLDNGGGVAVRGDGVISLGATTQTPGPFVFARASARLARDRGTLTDPGKLLLESFHVASDAGGTATAASGTTGYAGSFDAALVLITR